MSHSKFSSPQSHQRGNLNQVYICMFPYLVNLFSNLLINQNIVVVEGFDSPAKAIQKHESDSYQN